MRNCGTRRMKKALLVVDMQNDFISGSLAISDAKSIIGPINQLMATGRYEVIIGTMDIHPRDHMSFKYNGGLWPEHCVENTLGAALDESLDREHFLAVVQKGKDTNKEAYSAFDSFIPAIGMNLKQLLGTYDITDIDIVGLAFDYCVRATAFDSKANGFNTQIMLNYTRSVNSNNTAAIVNELMGSGVKIYS